MAFFFVTEEEWELKKKEEMDVNKDSLNQK